jgi:hypothetical protein
MKNIFRIITFSILILLLFACKNSDNKKKAETNQLDTTKKAIEKKKEDVWTIERLYKEYPYDFDTILKNGYHLHFEYFKREANSDIETQLTLMKGKKTIDTLNNMGYGIVMKNLGYIGADFNDYFAFVQSYGSGNPHEMQLLRKKDATEILNGFIVDADEKNELLLYCKGYDSLMLYDINRKRDKLLVNLNNCDYITCMVSQLCGNLKIKKVTQKQVEIEIAQDDNKTIRKMYYR